MCFYYAARGILTAIKKERNMRIHLCFSFYIVIAGFVTKLDRAGWTAVLLCIALVISLELVNTAIESVCDNITGDYKKYIETAKDCAAGAVLFSAAISAVTGCIVFFSDGHPANAIDFAQKHKAAAGIIVLTLPLWIYFIFHKNKETKK